MQIFSMHGFSMRKVTAIMVSALLFGAAWATQFPSQGGLVLVSAEGEVVGAGVFDAGNLDLELLAGFSGFATLTIVDESGNEVTTEVMIDSNSSVVITESLEDLSEAVAARGGEATVRVEERVDASGNMAFGAAVPDHVELPDVAQEAMDEAEERADGAKERGRERESSGAEASAGAEARAGARGEASAGGESNGESAKGERGQAEGSAGAEVDASVGVGVGVGNSSDR